MQAQGLASHTCHTEVEPPGSQDGRSRQEKWSVPGRHVSNASATVSIHLGADAMAELQCNALISKLHMSVHKCISPLLALAGGNAVQ